MLSSPARRIASALAVLGLLAVAPMSLRAAGDERRASWASRADLASVEAVRHAISTAATGAFDTVVVPASIFPSTLTTFDGLAEAVRQAHARGLRIYASIDVNRAVDADEVPGSRAHVLYQHPEWLMVPRGLAPEILALDVHSPDYIGRVARWTRANSSRVSGLYLSPLYPEAAAHIAEAVRALVEKYLVDGVELNDAEFPGDDFDYSRPAMVRFRSDLRPRLSVAEQKRMDSVEAIDPFAYADEHADEWRRFRQSSLTALVTRIRTAIKSVRPQIVVSATVNSDPAAALRDHLQDWRTWLDNGFVDAVVSEEQPSSVFTSRLEAAPGAR
jgi:uncharacterized lipoprotein YddW (UPF0748 family)